MRSFICSSALPGGLRRLDAFNGGRRRLRAIAGERGRGRRSLFRLRQSWMRKSPLPELREVLGDNLFPLPLLRNRLALVAGIGRPRLVDAAKKQQRMRAIDGRHKVARLDFQRPLARRKRFRGLPGKQRVPRNLVQRIGGEVARPAAGALLPFGQLRQLLRCRQRLRVAARLEQLLRPPVEALYLIRLGIREARPSRKQDRDEGCQCARTQPDQCLAHGISQTQKAGCGANGLLVASPRRNGGNSVRAAAG